MRQGIETGIVTLVLLSNMIALSWDEEWVGHPPLAGGEFLLQHVQKPDGMYVARVGADAESPCSKPLLKWVSSVLLSG